MRRECRICRKMDRSIGQEASDSSDESPAAASRPRRPVAMCIIKDRQKQDIIHKQKLFWYPSLYVETKNSPVAQSNISDRLAVGTPSTPSHVKHSHRLLFFYSNMRLVCSVYDLTGFAPGTVSALRSADRGVLSSFSALTSRKW